MRYVFDLDGTLTQEEILPRIASVLNLEDEMRTLTEMTMNGHINFNDSFRLRCAVLASIPISYVQEIISQVSLNQRILDFISGHKSECTVVTGNLDVWIAPLIEIIGCEFFTSTADEHDGMIVSVKSIMDKGKVCRRIRETRTSPIVSIGDGYNDIGLFQNSDFAIAYGGVHQPHVRLIDHASHIVYSEEALCTILNALSSRQQEWVPG